MSELPIGIGMIGLGTVGGGVAQLLTTCTDQYAARAGRRLELRKVLVRDVAKAKARKLVDPALLTDDPEQFFATAGLNVICEVAGGTGAAGQYVRRALQAGLHVVTANKSLLAAAGPELFALARQQNVSIAFEASCGGGIPIIVALKFGLMANRIDALYGILNGTCNYILTEMTQQGKTYATALKEAQDAGYAEADPTLDVSGRDAAQKLSIVAALAFGVRVDDSQVHCVGIDKLDLADLRFAREMGYECKLLAIAERTAAGLSLRVEPCFIHRETQLAQVHGSFNALSVYGHANGHTFYYGRGAGPLPTASAVVSDLLNIAAGWYPTAFAAMNLWPDQHEPADQADPDALPSRFYLRMNVVEGPGMMAKIAGILGEQGISISAVMQHESQDRYVPVVILTHAAPCGAVRKAARRIEALDVIRNHPVVQRIVEFPQG